MGKWTRRNYGPRLPKGAFTISMRCSHTHVYTPICPHVHTALTHAFHSHIYIQGRYFVAVSLAEAETLRAAVHLSQLNALTAVTTIRKAKVVLATNTFHPLKSPLANIPTPTPLPPRTRCSSVFPTQMVPLRPHEVRLLRVWPRQQSSTPHQLTPTMSKQRSWWWLERPPQQELGQNRGSMVKWAAKGIRTQAIKAHTKPPTRCPRLQHRIGIATWRWEGVRCYLLFQNG